MGELARRSKLSKQTMTTLISTMEAKGLVSRTRDPEDARAYRIYLSQRSRRFMSVAKKVLLKMDRVVQKRISDSQIANLRVALKILMNIEDHASADGSDPVNDS